MKATINGRAYDTLKAAVVDFAKSDLPRSDFRYWEEYLLYRPRAKDFFLHCAGAPMTIYAKVYEDGSRGWGEQLKPLTEQEALEWLIDHESPLEVIQRYFPDEMIRRYFPDAEL